MEWKKINIFTNDTEKAENALYMMDIYEFEIVDSFDEIKKELDTRAKYWDFIDEEKMKQLLGDQRIVVYSPDGGDELFEQIKEGLQGLDCITSVTCDDMADEDWLTGWKRFFKPISIGESILVVPCWQEGEFRDKTVIRIDPGMIFGTGGHETTRMCLTEIEKHISPGDSFLDLGCGSGILAIGAMLLGAKSALCVDIEENAQKAVLENGELSGVSKGIEVLVGDLLEEDELKERISKKKYDFIAANIVAGVIISLLSLVEKCLKYDGVFVCSGIIDDRVEEVRNALLENGFKIQNEQSEDKWTAFTVTK